jgi:DNA-binding NarL/FixJ family response regulator
MDLSPWMTNKNFSRSLMNDYRIILAEDHVVFRRLLRRELENLDGFTLVGEAKDGQELLALLEEVIPDLIILDISMPNLSGLEAAKRIRVSHPQVKILFLSMHKNPAYAQQAQKLGVAGYLLKEEMEQALLAAITQIRSGQPYFSPVLVKYLDNGGRLES